MELIDKLKPFYTLIGICYIKSINTSYNQETRDLYKKLLQLLVEEITNLNK